MKKVYLFTLVLLLPLAGCPVKQSDDELVASKCRLKVPIQKEQCEAVGVYGTKGGQLQGLPLGGKDELDR